MDDASLPPEGPPDGGAGRILDEPLTEALSRRYLAYALSTITQRALPDVRDGLKPVHRRLLYAMRLLRLDPETSAKKSARVVGDVIGKYHPHGDVAVYDALVRLAQDFAQRYPLIDGQGNFGNIDGDNPAAMRYTECRLTSAAQLLLDGIDEDAVDFRSTYDGEEEEPVVLPAGFPNLLANGSTGIAVGMATSIPPHNAAELIDACLLLLERPDATTPELMEKVPGPDFPTGGVIVETRESILEAYETGRGGIRHRARWTKEDTGRGTWRIVVTEIPYQVKKADLVAQIAGLIEAKKAPLLGDVNDESAEDIRLVLEPRARTVEPELLMESLFKLSDLEARFPVNLNVLDAKSTPRVMGLKAALLAFLEHRREVIVRRARFRLGKIEQRLHILAGLLIVFLNLDEVIRIVRFEDEPKAKLMAAFEIDDIQADAILNTRLRQLAKLEEMELRREHADLAEERDGIQGMLDSDKQQWKLVGAGLRHVREVLGPNTAVGKRRSTFDTAPTIDASASVEALVAREPITVILSERGWIRAARGRIDDPSELKFKEGDSLGFLVPAETTDKLLLFASDGRFFTLAGDKLPSARGQGEPLRLMLDLDDRVSILALFVYKPGAKRVLASKAGYGFVMPEDEAVAMRRAGKQVLGVDVAGACFCQPAEGDHLAVIGDNGKALIFPLAELPEMPRGKGVKLQSYREGGLRDGVVFAAADGAAWTTADGRARAWADWRDWLGRRAGAGKLAPRGFPASKRFRPS
ncbi:MAG TPA: DNA topoisomerase IV subunit A [Caulobacteraceae bacterium]|nr:DNA topoisomerase IV subunit A [Caulobacteraceae bacterium]